jgi:hypothetical protein
MISPKNVYYLLGCDVMHTGRSSKYFEGMYFRISNIPSKQSELFVGNSVQTSA